MALPTPNRSPWSRSGITSASGNRPLCFRLNRGQVSEVVKTDYVTPKDTITKAKTAHGEDFFSDGRILIVWLRPAAASSASK